MVLISEADLLLALLCLCFKHLLVLILDSLLDFLSLHQHRSCVSKVALLYLLASTLGATLSKRHRWLVTNEEVVLLIDVEEGRRRALLLVAVLRRVLLHHLAVAAAHGHRARHRRRQLLHLLLQQLLLRLLGGSVVWSSGGASRYRSFCICRFLQEGCLG